MKLLMRRIRMILIKIKKLKVKTLLYSSMQNGLLDGEDIWEKVCKISLLTIIILCFLCICILFTHLDSLAPAPGPITNQALVTPSGLPHPRLRLGYHCRAIHESVWQALVNIYGGGPKIPLGWKKITISWFYSVSLFYLLQS